MEGSSIAGDSTWFRVHPPGLAFDVGRGEARLSGARTLFVTHGHLDHCLGVPFVLSHRTLHREESTRVICPAALAEPLTSLVAAAEAMEGVRYEWELIPFEPGDRIEVGRDLAVEAFANHHVVPGLGYHLRRRSRRLAPALRGLSPAEIAARKRAGETVEEEVDEVWLSYCGDTTPDVLDRTPELYDSPVLLLECTFLAPELRSRAPRYGHVHVEDLVARAENFRNDTLILHHLSRRHRTKELRSRLEAAAPQLARRTVIVGEPAVGGS